MPSIDRLLKPHNIFEPKSDFSEVEYRNIYNLLESCSYLDDDRRAKVIKAIFVANYAHQGQIRESGQRYINHPLRVARMLSDMRLDADIISAGVLHDVLEDSEKNGYPVNENFIEKHFGSRVKNIALGCRNSEWEIKIDVTQLPRYKKETTASELKELENKEYAIRTGLKILSNFADDDNSYPEVAIIKLADTLDNLREPKAKPRRRAVKAEEVLKVRANLARFIGEHYWRNEMSTLAFEAYNPEMFYSMLQILLSEAGLDQSSYRPDDFNRYQTIQKVFEKIYSIPDVEQEISEIASPVFGGATQIVAGYPSLYALLRSWEKEMHTKDQSTAVFTKNDLYLKVTVIITNQPTNGQVEIQTRKLIDQFKSSGYFVEEPSGNHREKNFFYVRDSRQNQRFRVRVVSQQRYHHDIARVVDLYRTDVLPDERQRAIAKLGLLNGNYRELQKIQEGQYPEKTLETLIDHLDGGVNVISPNGKKTPLRHGATVRDYAGLIFGAGIVLTGFKVNGDFFSIEFVDRMLNDGDKVELI